MRIKKQYPRARHTGGSQTLAPNDVWNIPDGVHEVHGETTHTRFPFASVRTYRALAIDADGVVYGLRTLSAGRESGHDLEGQVSIDGRKYRGFTSSVLFQRADNSLVSVATIYVCMGDIPIEVPNLDSAPFAELEELQSRYHYERDNSRALICECARLSLMIRKGQHLQYEHVNYPGMLESAYEALPTWAKYRNPRAALPDVFRLTAAQASIAACALSGYDNATTDAPATLDGRTLTVTDTDALLAELDHEMHSDARSGLSTKAGENLRDLIRAGGVE